MIMITLEAPEHVLQEAGVALGRSYPHRVVVDLSRAAKKSCEAIREQRKRSRATGHIDVASIHKVNIIFLLDL